MTETNDITLDLPEELYERVKARAERYSMSPEDYLRALIEEAGTGQPRLPRRP